MKALIGAALSAYVKLPRHVGKPRMIRGISSIIPSVSVKSRYGVRMLTFPDATTAMSIVGVYDDVFRAVNCLKQGMAFIDVGANAGVFSLVAAQRVGPSGRVISFEPSPAIFRMLVDNISLNNLRNVTPFQAAIGEQTSFMNFDPASRSHSGGAHLSLNGSESVLALGGKELERLLEVAIGQRELVVKIDVEGAELIVLRALRPILTKRAVVRVIVEISPRALTRFQTDPQAIYAEMAGHQFAPTLGPLDRPVYNEVFEARKSDSLEWTSP